MDETEKQQLLAQLRDIHLPTEPSFWPPAPGWWALLLLVLAMAVLLRLWWRNWQLAGWRREALKQHQRLTKQPQSTASERTAVLSELSILMRRVALAKHGRGPSAALTDEAWLSCLDKIDGQRRYRDEVGDLLTLHPYMRSSEIQAEQLQSLLALTARTIRHAKVAS